MLQNHLPLVMILNEENILYLAIRLEDMRIFDTCLFANIFVIKWCALIIKVVVSFSMYLTYRLFAFKRAYAKRHKSATVLFCCCKNEKDALGSLQINMTVMLCARPLNEFVSYVVRDSFFFIIIIPYTS